MAATASTTSTQPDLLLDDLLYRVCEELQLDSERYLLAEKHYQAVGQWLEAPGSSLAIYRPSIYPQGSMRLNTTVEPLQGDEYDLDFVCEFSANQDQFRNPMQLIELVEKRLRLHGTYARYIEKKNRCIRLSYLHQFHLDILPGCHDAGRGGSCILVPDRSAKAWKASNPKGYAEWFEGRQLPRGSFGGRLLAKREPVPPQQAVSEKSSLQLCTQLVKRWREIRFLDNPAFAPASIVLTTLAGKFYDGEQSLSLAMAAILSRVNAQTRRANPRIYVWNPTNSAEDLSERWDQIPDSYRAFVVATREFETEWLDLLSTRGLHNVARRLEKLFGERVTGRVMRKYAEEVQATRGIGRLATNPVTGILTSVSAVGAVPVRPNNFYGEE